MGLHAVDDLFSHLLPEHVLDGFLGLGKDGLDGPAELDGIVDVAGPVDHEIVVVEVLKKDLERNPLALRHLEDAGDDRMSVGGSSDDPQQLLA